MKKRDKVKVVADQPYYDVNEGKTYAYDGAIFEVISVLDSQTALIKNEYSPAFEESITKLEVLEKGDNK